MAVKTNIKEVTVANNRLYFETALENKVEQQVVEDMVKHLGRFIAAAMKRGLMEAVMIPGFGKFKPKKSLIKARHKINSNRRSGMDLIYRAAKGMDIPEPKPREDETL